MDYILQYYKQGLFTDDDMTIFVSVSMITQAQYDSVKEVKRNDEEIL